MIKWKNLPGVSFYSAGKCYTCFWDKGPQGPYPAKDPAYYTADMPGKLNLCNNGMMIWEVTNDFLIGFEACFTVGSLNYHIYVYTHGFMLLSI